VNEPVSIRFKKRLKALRKERGWTQEFAAEKCGIPYKMLQFYELGIKKNPVLQTLEKIARGFGLDVSELLAPNFQKVRATKSTAKRTNPTV